MNTVGRWLRRFVLAAILIGALRCELDRDRLPSPRWLRHRQDLELVNRTFPFRWKRGTGWTIEYEKDAWRLTDDPPGRQVATYSVLEIDEDRALIEVQGDDGPTEETRFVWDMMKFRLEALPESEYWPPSTLAEGIPGWGWKHLDDDTIPLCFINLLPWQAPIVHRSTPAGEMLDVLGERWLGHTQQSAWIDNGLLRFDVHPVGGDDARLSIVWRPGDPWWAKWECYVPNATTNLPPVTRSQWIASGRPAHPRLTMRAVRARLVAIDGVPIEPLAWEHPPADWMDPSGR